MLNTLLNVGGGLLKGGMSDLVSGGISSMFGSSSSSKQEKAYKGGLHAQYEINKKYAQKQYPWMVKSLKDAGLNPILAASGGLGGGSPMQGSGFNPGMPAFSTEGTSSSAKQLTEIGSVEEDILNKQTQRGEIIARTQKALNDSLLAISNIAKNKQDIKVGESNVAKLGQEMQVLFKKVEKMGAEIFALNAEIELKESQIQTERERKMYTYDLAKQSRAMTQNIIHETAKIRYLLEEIAKTSSVFAGPAGKALVLIRQWREALGINLNASSFIGAVSKIPK